MLGTASQRAPGVLLDAKQQQLRPVGCPRSRAAPLRVAAVAQRSEGSRKRFLDLGRQKLVPARLLSCSPSSTVSSRPSHSDAAEASDAPLAHNLA